MRISPRKLIFSFKELGNVSQVAKMFGVSRMTVYRWVKRSKTGYEIFSTEFPKTLISKWQGHETEKHHRAWGYLQIDTKHVTPELSGLPFTVYEYAAIDIVSRYKVAVLLPEIDSESASLALEFFLKWFPFKVLYVQTDNGLEYQRSFELTCLKHGLNHYLIHKNSPNENAVIERSFRTDQDEFYYWLEKEPEHIGELNEWLQKFINQYNTVRPHQALNYITPFEAVKMYQMS